MKKERSPRFPGESLPESVARVERLYASAGRSLVTSEIAAEGIGYGSLSGASKTALAALAYYGLIQREGDKHRISELGLRLIRPISDKDKLDAARIATLRPPVFAQIDENHGECTEQVLSSILLRNGFTDDGARRAAKVYKENIAFIETLKQGTGETDGQTDERNSTASDLPAETPSTPAKRPLGGKMLAQYQIPLGANHAQLIVTGEELVAEDFDALADYVVLFKKQFQRAAKERKTPPKSDRTREEQEER